MTTQTQTAHSTDTRVQAQMKWILEHGGDVAGYIQNYGEKRGREIFAADLAELRRLESEEAAAATKDRPCGHLDRAIEGGILAGKRPVEAANHLASDEIFPKTIRQLGHWSADSGFRNMVTEAAGNGYLDAARNIGQLVAGLLRYQLATIGAEVRDEQRRIGRFAQKHGGEPVEVLPLELATYQRIARRNGCLSPAVVEADFGNRIAGRNALMATVFGQAEFMLVGKPGQLRRELVALAVGGIE